MSTTTASPQPGRSAAATHPLDALALDALIAALADNWWLIALRGVLLGIIALIMPVATILGAGAVVLRLFGGVMSARPAPPRRETARRKQQRLPEKPDATPSEDKIDESLKETFPASDPPSWTLVARIGSPRREHGTASDAGTDQDDFNEPSDDERMRGSGLVRSARRPDP